MTFYWKEKSEDREPQMRNWGVLQEKLEENKYKELNEYFDPKYVYAYTVEGECCWKIFNETINDTLIDPSRSSSSLG